MKLGCARRTDRLDIPYGMVGRIDRTEYLDRQLSRIFDMARLL
jgi:hypothetical protein